MAPVAPQNVTGSRRHVQSVGAGVFVGEKLAEVVSRKSPGVYNLLAMGIDDFHDLPGLHERSFSATGGDFYQRHLALLNAEPPTCRFRPSREA
jgi:hypothetical protein